MYLGSPKSTPVRTDEFRPISLLPVLSKVFEKLILDYYYESFMKVYDNRQFAYRRKSSTTCALISIHDQIVRLLDDPNVLAIRLVCFDMSKAFESVPHDLLLQRIIELDFPECNKFVNWLSSYLCERKQRVRLGNVLSSVTNVTSGVPQGSVLGPHLFSMFMSTFSVSSTQTTIVKYADDITMVIPVLRNASDDLCVMDEEILTLKHGAM